MVKTDNSVSLFETYPLHNVKKDGFGEQIRQQDPDDRIEACKNTFCN